MRKIRLFIAASADGFIAREDGGIEWLYTDADYGYKEFFHSVDTLLMGSKTYEQALRFGEWPFGGKKCYVCTRTRHTAADTRIEFASDAVALATQLREEDGADIWLVGGSQIISALLNAQLVDDIVLSIHPILIAKGIPLFAHLTHDVKMHMRSVTPYKSGLVQIHYDITRS